MNQTRKISPAALDVPGYTGIRVAHTNSTATVWEAVDEDSSVRVAVKVLSSHADVDRVRFERETIALSKLHTAPHVATLLRSGHRPGDRQPWLAFPWYDSTLADYKGTLTWKQVAAVGVGLCRGLGAAHAVGIVHRDLKPDNVLMAATHDGEPSPVLTDFGIAKVSDLATTTQVGIRGTFPFIAPERFTNPGFHGDDKSDVYALAGTLYTTLCGRLPVPAKIDVSALTDEQCIYLTIHEPAPPLPPRCAPKAFGALLSAGLSKDPGRRPTLAEFQAKLQSFHDRDNEPRPRRRPTATAIPPVAPDGTESDPAGDEPKGPLVRTDRLHPGGMRELAMGAFAVSAVLLVLAGAALNLGWANSPKTSTATPPGTTPTTTAPPPPTTTTSVPPPPPTTAAPTPPATTPRAELLGTFRPYKNEEPALHMAAFNGNTDGDVCISGWIDPGKAGTIRTALFQYYNPPSSLAGYDDDDKPRTSSMSKNTVNASDGAWTGGCFSHVCINGKKVAEDPGCSVAAYRRFVFQVWDGDKVLYRMGWDIGENMLPALPGYNEELSAEKRYSPSTGFAQYELAVQPDGSPRPPISVPDLSSGCGC